MKFDAVILRTYTHCCGLLMNKLVTMESYRPFTTPIPVSCSLEHLPRHEVYDEPLLPGLRLTKYARVDHSTYPILHCPVGRCRCSSRELDCVSNFAAAYIPAGYARCASSPLASSDRRRCIATRHGTLYNSTCCYIGFHALDQTKLRVIASNIVSELSGRCCAFHHSSRSVMF